LEQLPAGSGKTKYVTVISIADNIVPHEARPGDRLLTNYFVKSMQGFITMSKIVEQSLLKFDNVKPGILTPHPLYDNFGEVVEKQLALEKLNLDKSFKYLLFFGFIRDYKGLDILLEAMADERIRKMPLKLIVAGEFYTKPEPYLEFIKKHQLTDKVILYTNFIPNHEVPLYFSACHLVVQPYKNATQSGVTQVAMHFNKPIITTNVGGLANMVKHGVVGLVVEPNSKALADAINEALQNQLLEKFEKNMEAEKKRFSWDNMVASIEKLFSEVRNS
jgi:D-inositol-3-phosphate glycosyltransferase